MFAEKYIMQYGGPALNAAITNNLLGGKGHVVSCFGGSNEMQKSKHDLATIYGLDIIDLADKKDFKLPESAIFVNKWTSSRTIINSPRNERFELYSFHDLTIDDSSLILLDGYLFSEELYHKIQEARKRGCVVVLDGGSWKPNTNYILNIVDIAICSAGFCFPEKTRRHTIDFMREKGVQSIAFTNDGSEIFSYKKGSRVKIPVKQIEAIDTLGAGDVLHGAFCYYYSKGDSFHDALIRASEVATKSCLHFGTHTWKKHE